MYIRKHKQIPRFSICETSFIYKIKDVHVLRKNFEQ